MTQATGSSFFTQAMALATANTASTALPELIAFMGNRLGQTRSNQLLAKVGHLLTLEQQYTLHETYLYGSSRLGVKNQNTILSTRVASVQNGSLTPIGNAILNTDSVFTGTASAFNLPKAPSSRVFYRTWGLKQYELSNHLGNVQVTISDKKLGVLSSNQEDFIAYEPEVKSATDYYAYGMEMPGKGFQGTAYRYGMNTQEKDNEIYGPGNTYGALFWEYDARIARRWNVDPVVKEYEGAYTTFSGNPIWFVDINGDDSLKVNPETGNPTVQLPVLTVSAERVEPVNQILKAWLSKIQEPNLLLKEKPKEKNPMSSFEFVNNGLIGGYSTVLGIEEYTFKLIPDQTKRKIAYQASKIKDSFKSGQVYQNWKSSSTYASKMGQKFGYLGFGLSTVEYASNFDNATTGKHLNYWVSTGLFALSVFPATAPVFAPVAFVYSTIQFGAFIKTGKSIEERLLDDNKKLDK